MKHLAILASLLGACLLLPAPPAEAASFRCGIHLIQGGGRHGPTMYEVLRKCGEPKERRFSIWLYERRGRKWELRFSSNGILQTVRQER